MKIISVADFVALLTAGRIEQNEELLVVNKKTKKIVCLLKSLSIPEKAEAEQVYSR